MKRSILILLCLPLFMLSQEQKHKPYISIGPGIGTGITTYGLEFGGYTEKVWYAATVEYTPNTQVMYTGIRTYFSLKKFDSKAQLFASIAGKIGTEHKDLVAEPGLAFVYSLTDNWGLQWNITTPIAEETTFGNPIHLSTGACLNYWF